MDHQRFVSARLSVYTGSVKVQMGIMLYFPVADFHLVASRQQNMIRPEGLSLDSVSPNSCGACGFRRQGTVRSGRNG